MKKTILAVVTTSLFAASANAAVVFDKDGQQVDIYGRVQYEAGQIKNYSSDAASADYKDDASAGKAENFGGNGLARLGVNVKSATGYNDVALISKLEWELSSENDNSTESNSVEARYAWLGADFANGIQATVGRVENPFAELSDVTDTYNTYSGIVENQGASRWDDSAKVTYAADGWDLRTAVSFDDQGKLGVDDVQAQTRYAAAAGYTIKLDDISSLKPVLAYQSENGKDGTADYTNSQYAAGLGYTYDAFYLASTYGQAKTDVDGTPSEKATIWAVTGSYKVLPAVTLVAGFGQVDPHNIGDNTGVTSKYYVLGTQYDITAKAKAYAEYKIDEVSGQDDNYAVGLQYNF